MRGILKISRPRDLALRITPARAGNTDSVPLIFYGKEGSPPPVRGILTGKLDEMPAKGITPARAGNTVNLILRLSRLRDHPRPCGEYLGYKLQY